MTDRRPELRAIGGGGRTEKIALSLVHGSGRRIDVPVTAIHSIETREFSRFSKRQPPFPMPHVDVRLRYDIRARLYRLSQTIIGEPLEILVDGRSIARPIVRGPLSDLSISTFDLDEAQTLEAQLRSRCGITGPRAV